MMSRSGFYLNRASIELVRELRRLWGYDRSAQTNSRYNGSFCSAVRLYDVPADKGHAEKALQTITTLAELREEVTAQRSTSD